MLSRRKFINFSSIAAGVTAFTGLYTWQVEPFWLEFKHIPISLKQLPSKYIGKTMMQISDIHVGNRFDYQFIIDSFKKAAVYDPDIVVYTGDYITWKSAKQLEQLREVIKHAVKGKVATIAILGNHDYGHLWREPEVADTITQILKDEGILVLRNEKLNLDGIVFYGIDDLWGPNFDLSILDSFSDHVANIALCHNPDGVDFADWDHFKGLILSGHTHGGQCKAPFLKAPLLPVKNKSYDQGFKYLAEDRVMYINRALGHRYQMRFNVRPEISIFEFV